MNHTFFHQYRLVLDYFHSGGVLMAPLLITSLLMWLLILERSLTLYQLYRKNMGLNEAAHCIRENVVPDEKKYRGVVSLLVRRFLKHRSGRADLDRAILDEMVFHINSKLTAGLSIIGVLAAIAPLLGLLGTVLGMITTFDVLAEYGTGNSRAMAGGISEALITTQTGLLLAVPGLWMKNFLSRRAQELQQKVAAAGLYLSRIL